MMDYSSPHNDVEDKGVKPVRRLEKVKGDEEVELGEINLIMDNSSCNIDVEDKAVKSEKLLDQDRDPYYSINSNITKICKRFTVSFEIAKEGSSFQLVHEDHIIFETTLSKGEIAFKYLNNDIREPLTEEINHVEIKRLKRKKTKQEEKSYHTTIILNENIVYTEDDKTSKSMKGVIQRIKWVGCEDNNFVRNVKIEKSELYDTNEGDVCALPPQEMQFDLQDFVERNGLLEKIEKPVLDKLLNTSDEVDEVEQIQLFLKHIWSIDIDQCRELTLEVFDCLSNKEEGRSIITQRFEDGISLLDALLDRFKHKFSLLTNIAIMKDVDDVKNALMEDIREEEEEEEEGAVDELKNMILIRYFIDLCMDESIPFYTDDIFSKLFNNIGESMIAGFLTLYILTWDDDEKSLGLSSLEILLNIIERESDCIKALEDSIKLRMPPEFKVMIRLRILKSTLRHLNERPPDYSHVKSLAPLLKWMYIGEVFSAPAEDFKIEIELIKTVGIEDQILETIVTNEKEIGATIKNYLNIIDGLKGKAALNESINKLSDIIDSHPPNDKLKAIFEFVNIMCSLNGQTALNEWILKMFKDDSSLVDCLKEISKEKQEGKQETVSFENAGVAETFLNICYHIKETFPNSYKEVLLIVINKNDKDIERIRSFVQKGKEIHTADRIQIFEDLRREIPTYNIVDGIRDYFKETPMRLFVIVHLFLCFLDVTSDIGLTVSYYNWNITLDSFVLENRNRGIMVRVEILNPLLPFVYALTVLVLTELFQVAFFLYEKKNFDYALINSSNPVRKILVWIFIGLLLPFVTVVYRLFSEIQMKRFEGNLNKTHTLYENNPQEKEAKKCSTCTETIISPDTRPERICVMCGYSCNKSVRNIYKEQIKQQHNELAVLSGNIKLLLASTEDAYMPILQFYILIPFLYSIYENVKYSYKSGSIGESLNPMLILSCYSIATSLINTATALTLSYFSNENKSGLGNSLVSKFFFLLSFVFLISGRLLMLEYFGLVRLPGKYAPIWMALICVGHCMIFFGIKCILTYCVFSNQEKNLETLPTMLMSSFASVFTFSRIGQLHDECYSERESTIKSWERATYTILIMDEQILMTIAILLSPTAAENIKKMEISNIVLPVLWGVFLLGLLMQWICLVFLNPWANLRSYYVQKKYTLITIIILLVLAIVIVIMYFEDKSRITIGFILSFVVVGLILLYGRVSCCTKRNQESGNLLDKKLDSVNKV